MKELTSATVKYPAQDPRENRFGRMRINVVFTLPDGQETKVWADPGDPITELRKGDRCALLKDKNNYTLVSRESLAAQAAPGQAPASAGRPGAGNTHGPASIGWNKPTKDERAAMIEFAQFIVKMQKHCYDNVCEQFRNTDLSPGEKKDLATTATLSILRRWRLQ